MTRRILPLLPVICAVFALSGTTTDDFTVRCTIDISGRRLGTTASVVHGKPGEMSRRSIAM